MKSLKNYGPLIILVLLIDTIAEFIGMQVFKIGKIEVSILPLVFAVILAIIIYLLPLKPIKQLYNDKRVKFAGKYMILIMLPLMARYGANVASVSYTHL